MPRLPLAVEIADTISNHRRNAELDVETTSEQLFHAHPEADASQSEIAETLREEGAAVGLVSMAEAEL
jgi:hypothetical protein